MFSRFGVQASFDWADALALVAMAFVVVAGAWLVLRIRRRGVLRYMPPPFPFKRVPPEALEEALPSLGRVEPDHVSRTQIAEQITESAERVAFVGARCSGKTHEAARLARETAEKRAAGIYVPDGPLTPPTGPPPDDMDASVVLLIDDPFDWLPDGDEAACGQDVSGLVAEVGVPDGAERAAQAIEWFEKHTPDSLFVILTATPQQWERARSAGSAFEDFDIVEVGALNEEETAEYVASLCGAFGFEEPEDAVVEVLTRANDGAFGRLYDFVSDLRASDPERAQITKEDAEGFERRADRVWDDIVSERLSNVERDVLTALSALRACGVPLYEQFISSTSARITRRRTRTQARDAALRDALRAMSERWLSGDRSGRIVVHESRLTCVPEDRTEALKGVALAVAEVSPREVEADVLAFALGRIARQLEVDSAGAEMAAVGDALLGLPRRDWRGELWAAQGSLALAAAEDDATYVSDAAQHLRAAAELVPEAAADSLRARVLLAAGAAAVESQAAGRGERLEYAIQVLERAAELLRDEAPVRQRAESLLERARAERAERGSDGGEGEDSRDDSA